MKKPANPLGHIAFVIDSLEKAVPGRLRAAEAAFAKAGEIAAAALAAHPGLAVVSFFSTEIRDWLFDPAEGRALAEFCARGLESLAEAVHPQNAGLRILGRTQRLPAPLRAFAVPAVGSPRTIAWFLDYGGRDEIVRAAERFLRARPGAPLTEEEFSSWLDTAGMPDPDLVLHAGGGLEPEDFLVWQASYAEIWHTPRPWPEFRPEDLAEAVNDYFARHRRFGR